MTPSSAAARLRPPRLAPSRFELEVLSGLRRRPRRLPCKYFYDERGSRLFDRICELPEYYLTRTELAILERHGPDIARRLGGPGGTLVELGSGSSRKTRVLLDHLPQPAAYLPVDISREHLLASAAAIADDYPGLAVTPICADFAADEPLCLPPTTGPRTVFFPGSSLGNFHRLEAERLLARIGRLCGPGGALLIGIDLDKDPRVMARAYDDSAGVTAEFNRNLLVRINRELGGDFEVEAWRHHAFYQPIAGRIEMHLVSREHRSVTVAGEAFEFDAGESIRTECSYKYTVEGFMEMARGFSVEAVWTDRDRWFAVLLLRAPGDV